MVDGSRRDDLSVRCLEMLGNGSRMNDCVGQMKVPWAVRHYVFTVADINDIQGTCFIILSTRRSLCYWDTRYI